MSESTLYISIRRLKVHEFFKTVRFLKKTENWPNLYEEVCELQNRAIAAFVKSTSPLLLSYLLISSLNSDGLVSITIQGVTAGVPTAYFAAVSSFAYLMSMISLIHLLIVFSIRGKTSTKLLFPNFSVGVYALLRGFDDAALGLPTLESSFFSEKMKTSRILEALLLAALLSLLVPIVSFGAFLILVQLEVMRLTSTSWLEWLSSLAGISIVIFTFFYAIAFHIPFPMTKNRRSIRWSFLSVISTRFPHPRAKSWLSDQNKN